MSRGSGQRMFDPFSHRLSLLDCSTFVPIKIFWLETVPQMLLIDRIWLENPLECLDQFENITGQKTRPNSK